MKARLPLKSEGRRKKGPGRVEDDDRRVVVREALLLNSLDLGPSRRIKGQRRDSHNSDTQLLLLVVVENHKVIAVGDSKRTRRGELLPEGFVLVHLQD